MRICTIVARNYLAYARVLAESFLAQRRLHRTPANQVDLGIGL
jgi:hypothetical protein